MKKIISLIIVLVMMSSGLVFASNADNESNLKLYEDLVKKGLINKDSTPTEEVGGYEDILINNGGGIEYTVLEVEKIITNKKGEGTQIQCLDRLRKLRIIFDFSLSKADVALLKKGCLIEYAYEEDLLDIMIGNEYFYSDELGIN